MKIAETTPATIRDFWGKCTSRLGGLAYLDEVAAIVTSSTYEQFAESLVMIRAFLTVPFRTLPPLQRDFAIAMARSVNLEPLLGPSTPVHSLLATRGCIEEWNHAQSSRGHIAIPLLSEAFVASIPMMSRLLKELGLPLTWVDDPGGMLVRETIGTEVGFFYVADAASAIDELGRKIIPAQEFVAQHGVASVFAVGGVVFGGSVLVLILFSRDRVEARTARTFMPLINLLKGIIISQYSTSKVFRPGEGDAGMIAPEIRAPRGK